MAHEPVDELARRSATRPGASDSDTIAALCGATGPHADCRVDAAGTFFRTSCEPGSKPARWSLTARRRELGPRRSSSTAARESAELRPVHHVVAGGDESLAATEMHVERCDRTWAAAAAVDADEAADVRLIRRLVLREARRDGCGRPSARPGDGAEEPVDAPRGPPPAAPSSARRPPRSYSSRCISNQSRSLVVRERAEEAGVSDRANPRNASVSLERAVAMCGPRTLEGPTVQPVVPSVRPWTLGYRGSTAAWYPSGVALAAPWHDGEGVLFGETTSCTGSRTTRIPGASSSSATSSARCRRIPAAINRFVIRRISAGSGLEERGRASTIGRAEPCDREHLPLHLAVRRLKRRNRRLYYALKYGVIRTPRSPCCLRHDLASSRGRLRIHAAPDSAHGRPAACGGRRRRSRICVARIVQPTARVAACARRDACGRART